MFQKRKQRRNTGLVMVLDEMDSSLYKPPRSLQQMSLNRRRIFLNQVIVKPLVVCVIKPKLQQPRFKSPIHFSSELEIDPLLPNSRYRFRPELRQRQIEAGWKLFPCRAEYLVQQQ